MALEAYCGAEDILKSSRTLGFGAAELNDNVHFPEMRFHTQLAMPPFSNVEDSLAKLNDESSGIKMNFDHGTTTLGFKYQGGVILAVDSRATGGQYIGSQTMKKIVEINPYLLGTLAGGAADCVYWDRVLSKQCRLYELRNRERISVAAASKLMANMIYSYKGMGLSMGMMFAGWDKRGPSLYFVSDDGTRTQGEKFSVGSGSIYAIGVLNAGHRHDLKDEEAYDLGQRAIYHATRRDAYSGGIVRVYHIKSDGWLKISEVDCMDIHYKLYPPEPMPGPSSLGIPMEQ